MPSYAYFQKQFVPLAEAKLGIMTNALHYGTAVFEGIRGNWNPQKKQIYLFRLKEHFERLHDGCRALKMKLDYTTDELCQIMVKLVEMGRFEEDIYIRPLAYESSEAMGVRLHNLESDFFAFVIAWGPYLDMETAKCKVSSWRFPREVPRAKFTGLYITNAAAKTEAAENGFDEAIMLTAEGYVAEGSGENIFLLKEGKLVTPAGYDGILLGITRNTVIQLAQDELRIETVERHVGRMELYSAEECFLTGTAAHITAVGEIDHRPIANGKVGAVTKKLQRLYFEIIRGNNPKYLDWCTPVYKRVP